MTSNKVSLVDRKPVKKSRSTRRLEAAIAKRRVKVIKKMFAVLKPTEPMTREELKTEAYLLHKNKYLTKQEARIMGCVLR